MVDNEQLNHAGDNIRLFKYEFVFWSQFEIGACALYTNNRSEINFCFLS